MPMVAQAITVIAGENDDAVLQVALLVQRVHDVARPAASIMLTLAA